MGRIIKAILLTIAIACAGVSVFFIITIIGNRDIVVDAYNSLSSASKRGADAIRTNFLQVYSSYGEELFIALGVNKTDYAPGGIGDSDPGTGEGSDILHEVCTCTDMCTSDTDFDDTCEVCKVDWQNCAYVPPCTCSGPDRCTQGNVDNSCEACKLDIRNCMVILPTITGGEIGGRYEGTWCHVQQGSEAFKVTSVNNTKGKHCFFVAVNALSSGLSGRQVTLEEVFTADGQTWVCDQNTGLCKTSKDHNGSVSRANNILSNLGISDKLANATSVTKSGTYLVYVKNNKNWSSGGFHWFTIHNGTLMTNAGDKGYGYSLTDADLADINKSVGHIGKVE